MCLLSAGSYSGRTGRADKFESLLCHRLYRQEYRSPSDLEAALLTLGYAGGEAWILNTGLGEWILPELHIDKFKNKAIAEALVKPVKDAKKALESDNKNEASEFWRKVFGDRFPQGKEKDDQPTQPINAQLTRVKVSKR